MTIEMIIAQLDTIADDSWYFVSDNNIDLTIDDFAGFDEDWCEMDRELVDPDAVDAVLEWLKANADSVTGDFYRYFHFGDVIVQLGWTSFDI